MENRKHATSVFRPIDSTDITTWNLPQGATARIGTGWISGDMAFSPDGQALVVATTIGCWWYDLNTMELRAWWNSEQGILYDIAFSQDARWLATGNWNGDVKVFDTQNLQCVANIDKPINPEGVLGLSGNLLFSQDGQHLTRSNLIFRDNGSGRHFTVYDWRENTDTPIASYTVQPKSGKRNVHPTALSPDGSLVAYTPEVNITSVMHVETGEHIAKLRDDYIDTPGEGCYKLLFSPCGKYLAACNRGNKLHVWNIQNGTLEIAPTAYCDSEKQGTFRIPAYTLDGTLQIAGISNGKVMIWDTTRQETVDTLESWIPLNGCFSSDGTQLAIRNKYGELQVWTRGKPSMVKSLPTHISRGVVDVRFSKDSRTLISSHDPTGYRLWDIVRRQVKQTFYLPRPNSLGVISISRSRELLAALEENKIIRVWNLVSDTQVAELTEKHKGVTRMTFSPAEEYLATTNIRKIINIWHVASSTQIAELSQNPSRIVRMEYSPNGEHFVSFYGDSFTIWDTTRWEKRHHVPLPEVQSSKRWQLLFHPDDKHVIIVPRENPIHAWDLKSGKQAGSLDTKVCLDTALYKGTSQDIQRFHEQPETVFQRIWGKLRMTSCGTRIAGVIRRSGRNEIRLWDTTTLETYMVIIPPTGCQNPQSSAFSPCGNYLAVGAKWQDGQAKMSVRLWDVNTGENIHTFWGHPTDVWSLDFSPDGELLASGSYDGTILLWDVKSIIGS